MHDFEVETTLCFVQISTWCLLSLSIILFGRLVTVALMWFNTSAATWRHCAFGCHNAMGWWVISWSKWLWDVIDSKTSAKIGCKDSWNVCTLHLFFFYFGMFLIPLVPPFLLQESVDAKGVGCDANAEVEGRGGVLCQDGKEFWWGITRNYENVWKLIRERRCTIFGALQQIVYATIRCISLLQAFGW